MIIGIPDDYHGLVPTLDCFRLLDGHDVRVFREAAPTFETVVSNLRDAEIVVPIRERTRFSRELIAALPRLKLTPETRGLVTAGDLAQMKADSLLVNTARAELIEPGALEAALRRGHPGFAAVDVYENEPVLGGDHPLLRLPNALCTAHSAWLEKTTYELYFGEAFENAAAFAAGQPQKLINPEVLNQ